MGKLFGKVSITLLVLALGRTLLVLDGMLDFHGYGSSVHRILSYCREIASPSEHEELEVGPAVGASHPSGRESLRKSRWLHLMLILMHVFGCSAAAAGTWTHYMRHPSYNKCFAAFAWFYISVILFQSALVLFLLAKTRVTNMPGSRRTCWERAIPPFSLLFAWAYKPATAAFLVLSYGGGVNIEGNECTDGLEDMAPADARQQSIVYLVNQILLLLQLALLLALFLKPLVVIGSVRNRSAMVVYRRVFVRNAVCTAVMMAVLVPAASFAYAEISPTMEMPVDNALEISYMLYLVLTLYITEITIPFGFSSCTKTCAKTCSSEWGKSWANASTTHPDAVATTGGSNAMVPASPCMFATSITV